MDMAPTTSEVENGSISLHWTQLEAPVAAFVSRKLPAWQVHRPTLLAPAVAVVEPSGQAEQIMAPEVSVELK